MKFNKLIKSILKPINEKIHPHYSGEVERYITFVRSITQFPYGPWRVEHVQVDEHGLFQHEYVKEVCYEGTEFHNAFSAYVRALQDNGVYVSLIADAKHEAWRFTELDGIAFFKVCVLPTIVYMKVEVDSTLARSKQINKGLEDVDTTGFEDLL